MRLAKIKLAGFKSFVDPTQVRVPSNLVGIVGPNGCGKSNIIDAVRWVLGETSAKHLRGGSMADVIFSGSSSRKPVGRASIELTFDNSEGKAGGEYAKYAEIAIKREVTRDGQSQYFLNGSRCRRRDITDLFLGTGLGPRSYAIIEQGMITRVIEAKPEEMRAFLEEAAGISKYKERRRETENRIRHTQENLDRLNDLREEVDKQLQHLQRQARTAERYKLLKQEERETEAGLLAVRIQELDRQGEKFRSNLNNAQTDLEAAIAVQRGVELEIEQAREAHIESTEKLNDVQGNYYQVGAEISRLEQAIKHARELSQRQAQELQEADRSLGEIEEHLSMDTAEMEELRIFLEESEPKLEEASGREEAAQEDQMAAEEALQAWQERWDAFNEKASEPARAAEVELSRIDQFDRQVRQHGQRLERLQHERQTLIPDGLEEEVEAMAEEAESLEASQDTVREELDSLQERITTLRDDSTDTARERDELRMRGQQVGERLASLTALQQAALGVDSEALEAWLQERGLDDKQRLAQRLDVDEGWEKAVEIVLGPHLEALCVEQLAAANLDGLPGGSLELLVSGSQANAASPAQNAPLLNSRVRGDSVIASLLSGTYCVDSLAEAEALATRLNAGETVVTRDGLLMGPGWVRLAAEGEAGSGVLEREQEIKVLSEENETLSERLEETAEQLEEQRSGIRDLEMRRDELQADMDIAHRQLGDVRARLGARQARLEQIKARSQRLEDEIAEVQEQIELDRAQMEEAHTRRARAVEAMEELARERETLAVESDQYRNRLDETRAASKQVRDEAHRLALEVRSQSASQKSLEQNMSRLTQQREQIKNRRDELLGTMEDSQQPTDGLAEELEVMLERRVEAESALTAARGAVGDLDNKMRELDQRRMTSDQKSQDLRSKVEQQRLELKQVEVKREDQVERLDEAGFHLETLMDKLTDQDSVPEWEKRVSDLGRKIDRLGPINLAAIDEYKEQGERKEYLDTQFEDLTEAMGTLEGAIRKIDKETRTRFKETFDKVNAKLQEMFPRLFGGGHAYLELTGDDLLETGVSIMARPPGKRISSIQLMSGGEKALTAAALVFAFFELNPAPFCLLDEVDAPLDDANVGRFCDLVREMSERVQFVFISHNKIAMEMANELLGVTMHEPGVSRLVAVDVDEAVRLANM